jgi:hypothetical protein
MSMSNKKVAAEILKLAKELAAAPPSAEPAVDEKFVAKLKAIRQSITRLSSKKNTRLNAVGVANLPLKSSDSVSDLVDAMLAVVNSVASK